MPLLCLLLRVCWPIAFPTYRVYEMLALRFSEEMVLLEREVGTWDMGHEEHGGRRLQDHQILFLYVFIPFSCLLHAHQGIGRGSFMFNFYVASFVTVDLDD